MDVRKETCLLYAVNDGEKQYNKTLIKVASMYGSKCLTLLHAIGINLKQNRNNSLVLQNSKTFGWIIQSRSNTNTRTKQLLQQTVKHYVLIM
jgi:ribosomal protein S3AE